MTRLAPLLALFVASGSALAAQRGTPAFEVASIQPSAPGTSLTNPGEFPRVDDGAFKGPRSR